jgi:hypothetical protein
VTQLLEFDQQEMAASFAKAPMAVKHNLVDHPLFNLERIAQLADSLDESQIESNPGDVPEVLPGGEVPKTENLSPGEIVRGIDTNGYWIVLKRVNTDPEYRQLLDDSLDYVIPLVAHREGGAVRKEAFIFISAPNSTTPSHIDPEHNLLLQIRGSKTMVVGGFESPQAEQEEIERYYGGGHRNLPTMPADAQSFELNPGDGVYMPVHAPHMVKNGPEISVSFSITFYTEASERLGDLYSVNARLRKLGLKPSHPGQRPGADRLKAGAWAGLRALNRTVRKATGRAKP